MIVTRILNQNQAFVECPACGRETLWQRVTDKGLDYWFCNLDFQRTHILDHHQLFQSPEPKPKLVPPNPDLPKPIFEERVVTNVLGLREFEQPVTQPNGWTYVLNGRTACKSCHKYVHHKPTSECTVLSHYSNYQRSLATKRAKSSLHTTTHRKRA